MVRFTGRKEASSPAEERLIFTGIAIPEGQSDSVPIYGTLNTDGSGLDCHALSDYALSSELIAYEDEVWFPEDFLNATGKLLVTDPTGQIIRTVELEGEDTGNTLQPPRSPKTRTTGTAAGECGSTTRKPEKPCGSRTWERM